MTREIKEEQKQRLEIKEKVGRDTSIKPMKNLKSDDAKQVSASKWQNQNSKPTFQTLRLSTEPCHASQT